MLKRLSWYVVSLMIATISANTTALAQKAGWEAEWSTILAEAKKEGKVAVIGGTTVAALHDSVRAFKEKFGIDLLIITGRGSELTPRLLQERKSGIYFHDVMITGHSDIVGLKPAGVFDPLEPMLVIPEVVDQKLWYEGKYDWCDDGRYIFNFALYPAHMVVINTDLVKPGEIQSYHDLLNPKWKDNIVINDPTITGHASDGFISMVWNKLADLDLFRKLAAQKNPMTRDQDLQNTWVAKGKYPIALWPSVGRLAKNH